MQKFNYPLILFFSLPAYIFHAADRFCAEFNGDEFNGDGSTV